MLVGELDEIIKKKEEIICLGDGLGHLERERVRSFERLSQGEVGRCLGTIGNG